MKKIQTILLVLIFCIGTAMSQTPVITMTTSQAINSTISFSLHANAANTPVQVDFGDGTLVNKIIGTSTTTISDSLVGSQTVKIYGTGITYLDCRYNQLTALDVTANTALTMLLCSNNRLTSLDVSKNTALTQLICFYNQLTSLDVTQNTKLQYLYCDNNQLTALDVTQNTTLQSFTCYHNQLTSLDVSKNTALTEFGCYNNKLTTLDITKNKALTAFSCYYNQLTALDVTQNTALIYLECPNNQFTVLDVTQNTALTQLWCDNNQLTTLDVSKNKSLTDLECSTNQLTFATLPLKQVTWTTFSYAPQKSISIIKALGLGIELDLSGQLTTNSVTTVYVWKTKGGTTLIEGTDYTIANGKTIFLKAHSDSVYCEMTNTTFPDFTGANVLKTSNTKVGLTNAIEDMKTLGLDIYTHYKTLTIDLSYNAQLSIFDANGRLVMSKPVNSGTSNLQLQNTGVYLVKLTGSRGVVTRKVFIE
jgi:hypothetical protein